MIPRRLFVGEAAVDSILRVSENVDLQLLNLCHQRGFKKSIYEPWMAIPHEMLSFDVPPDWSEGELFFSTSELLEFRSFIQKMNPLGPGIFSLENYPIRVCVMDDSHLNEFRKAILEAKFALEAKLPWITPIYNKLIRKIVPIEAILESSTNDYGMSAVWLKGVVFYDKGQRRSLGLRIENIAHELAHQILINYQLSDKLIDCDLNTPVYSGIRNGNRPAIMALHGAAALTYMAVAADAYGSKERVDAISKDLRRTILALEQIELTAVGRAILREMYEFT